MSNKMLEARNSLVRIEKYLSTQPAEYCGNMDNHFSAELAAIEAALTQQHEPAGLDKLDPRVGDGEKIAHDLYDAYRKAFDKFAGPPEFRHSCNYDDYHKAGLLGVYVHCKRVSPPPSAQVPKKIPVPEPILYGPVLDNADQIGYAEGWNSCVDAMTALEVFK